MAGTLYVVATPIGNFDDFSHRSEQTLKTCQIIAAEDTRHSGHLLSAYSINTPTTACHDHNEGQKVPELIARLQQGDHVSLISDAGTPLISDPGFRLVRAAHEAGIKVVPVPGACAAIAALSASGLPSDRFSFEGFLPAKTHARKQTLEGLKKDTRTLIFYEAPHRILDSLSDFVEVFGINRDACLAREITKTFETIKKSTLGELLAFVQNDNNQQRGEIVLVIGGFNAEQEVENTEVTDKLLKRLLQDLPVKAAAQLAAELTGLKKNELYQRALSLKDQ
ncbi:16S rRNA (cytidine(1402)-2'-O)-methyltransferase [Aquirhabdus parva]|uniref:Ribosomal RNA small subunit methyltransferase I n=1 Tax=Aquirhabdus parva TaxID=2283318 RepID=A0A345P589_9GAMM|nr:16S rRNA (cytidine(1402)-2'-O)-methyltransferase [Aquirhabdus parva]AXI02448.1 16S rRNA (cytidine(1402)-2'-O)-methyltransferase [Aquirhabdus parva]